MTTATLGLDRLAGRCAHGFDIKAHHPHFCSCTEGSEWAIFLDALDRAADAEGYITQTRMRPLIRGRIQPKHIGLLYRRARKERLIVEAGWEDGTDTTGGNADKPQRRYRRT